ncbi:MAG: Flp pilus assembly protein CpaB, partial [Blastocatellia bacterium]
MNRRFLIALAGAVVFGLLAIFLAQKYVTQRVQQRIAQDETTVIIATVDIPQGTQITPQQITLARFKRELVPEGAMRTEKEVTDRVSVSDIAARTVVTGKQLAGLGAKPGLESIVKEGMR